jgi:hypothetical protein
MVRGFHVSSAGIDLFPDFLAGAAEQLGRDASSPGQANRLGDLAKVLENTNLRPFELRRLKVSTFMGVEIECVAQRGATSLPSPPTRVVLSAARAPHIFP